VAVATTPWYHILLPVIDGDLESQSVLASKAHSQTSSEMCVGNMWQSLNIKRRRSESIKTPTSTISLEARKSPSKEVKIEYPR
jgi:hypothetical protein